MNESDQRMNQIEALRAGGFNATMQSNLPHRGEGVGPVVRFARFNLKLDGIQVPEAQCRTPN
jgi:hypothetical protein